MNYMHNLLLLYLHNYSLKKTALQTNTETYMHADSGRHMVLVKNISSHSNEEIGYFKESYFKNSWKSRQLSSQLILEYNVIN